MQRIVYTGRLMKGGGGVSGVKPGTSSQYRSWQQTPQDLRKLKPDLHQTPSSAQRNPLAELDVGGALQTKSDKPNGFGSREYLPQPDGPRLDLAEFERERTSPTEMQSFRLRRCAFSFIGNVIARPEQEVRCVLIGAANVRCKYLSGRPDQPLDVIPLPVVIPMQPPDKGTMTE